MPDDFLGKRYYADVKMGMFPVESLEPKMCLDKENGGLPVGDLGKCNVYVHDSRLSPQNAAVKLPEKEKYPKAVWSVVINPTTQKAAVTLHWLFDADGGAFKKGLKEAKNFRDVMAYFKENPLLPSLEQLTKSS